MAKRMRRVRTFARTATKTQEKHLIENAKHLRTNPYSILPDTKDSSCEKHLNQLKKRIDKAIKHKDDAQKLEKIANKKGLDAAVAGTLLLAISEKAPYLGVIKLPTGDITYAQRGKAEKEKLIGTQHHTDPILRLMVIKDLAFKKKLYIYSWDTGYLCTGKIPQPPQGFIDFISKELNQKQQQNIVYCPHLHPEKIKQGSLEKEHYLRIHWQSADWYLGICEDCARETKNSMITISKYMLAPTLSEDFEISIIAEVIKQEQKNTTDTIGINDYLSGKLSDYQFIQKNIKSRKETIADSEEQVFILDGTSYGNIKQDFIEALKPTPYEKKALNYILSEIEESIIFDDANANKVLEKYWKNHGKSYLKTIISDENMVDSFYKLDEPPSSILQFVEEFLQRQSILQKYPQFTKLPPLAEYVDTLIKTNLTFGKKKAITMLKQHPDTPKGRSVAYAFALIFKKAHDYKWKYSAEEIESGEFLKTYVQKALECDPSEYAQCLQEILVACGSNETIPK